MEKVIYLLLAGLLGYLFGAIPFGYIYVKTFKGIDITRYGSGRTGGTNSYRAAGLWVGVLTAFSDVIKGFAGIWLTRALFSSALGETWLPWAIAVAGVMAVVGHNWSIFLKWSGGAGTGPNVGWAAAIWWPMFPIGFLVMGALLLLIGMASIASLAMAAVVPILFAVLYFAGIPGYDGTLAYTIGGIVAAAIIAWALRPNIKRVLDGTERIVGPRARAAARRKRA
jgi:acyl phosphate:glycerol-3-phosphate acyltransferase